MGTKRAQMNLVKGRPHMEVIRLEGLSPAERKLTFSTLLRADGITATPPKRPAETAVTSKSGRKRPERSPPKTDPPRISPIICRKRKKTASARKRAKGQDLILGHTIGGKKAVEFFQKEKTASGEKKQQQTPRKPKARKRRPGSRPTYEQRHREMIRPAGKTKFRRLVTDRLIRVVNKARDLPSYIDALTEAWKIFTMFHRKVAVLKGERAQEKVIPDTYEMACMWKVFLRLQDRMRRYSLSIDIEFAPFMVYGRTIEDREKNREQRWQISDEFDFLPLRSVASFVKWAEPRRKRVVALYFNLKRSHTMALMFKPRAVSPANYVGLHKFDTNAPKKSHADISTRATHFPNTSFYINTTIIQGQTDFTCTFWCMHWVLWKSIAACRFKLATEYLPESQGKALMKTAPMILDSFRSDAYKKWAAHMRAYICTPAAQAKPPTRFGLLLLTDPAWLNV